MGGHVFVVHGDLTHLACDDWLLPSDRDLTLTEAWLPALAEDAVRRSSGDVPRLALEAPAEFCEGARRVLQVPDEVRAERKEPSPLTHGRPWLLDVGEDADIDPGWLGDGGHAGGGGGGGGRGGGAPGAGGASGPPPPPPPPAAGGPGRRGGAPPPRRRAGRT